MSALTACIEVALRWYLLFVSETLHMFFSSLLLKCPLLSSLHASVFIVEDSLGPDSSQLYIDEIKPLFLQFLMMISSKGDSAGNPNDWFCIEEMKFLTCKYSIKCLWKSSRPLLQRGRLFYLFPFLPISEILDPICMVSINCFPRLDWIVTKNQIWSYILSLLS